MTGSPVHNTRLVRGPSPALRCRWLVLGPAVLAAMRFSRKCRSEERSSPRQTSADDRSSPRQTSADDRSSNDVSRRPFPDCIGTSKINIGTIDSPQCLTCGRQREENELPSNSWPALFLWPLTHCTYVQLWFCLCLPHSRLSKPWLPVLCCSLPTVVEWLESDSEISSWHQKCRRISVWKCPYYSL